MEAVIDDTEKGILNELNRYRKQPESFSKSFSLTAKFIGRFSAQKNNSVELTKHAESLFTLQILPEFIISEGLSNYADKYIQEIKQFADDTSKFTKISQEDFENNLKEYVSSVDQPFMIVDFGSLEQLIARLMISDLDPQRLNFSALRNIENSTIGFATKLVEEDDDTYCSVIILAKKVEEITKNKEDDDFEVKGNKKAEEIVNKNEEKEVLLKQTVKSNQPLTSQTDTKNETPACPIKPETNKGIEKCPFKPDSNEPKKEKGSFFSILFFIIIALIAYLLKKLKII